MVQRKAPSYKGLKSSSERASKALSGSSKHADTNCERVLRSTLWRMGLRFKKNVRSLPSKPDIVFSRQRLAVFCDGDFWHGRNWEERERKLKKGANPGYWVAKIRSNMERDLRYSEQLKELGWTVIRLWEGDIASDPIAAARIVAEAVLGEKEAGIRVDGYVLSRNLNL